ncbi:DUF3211 domain-containing protein [Acidianus manzaensis]|uniref:DUF3211 domain-containing protein n=1 Tax=Acidianus manzaensis TaxID=282676 RepID=A0A1W6JXB6_9CREN|nr:DUF3211 domain-containing protein [Acidianus manzaensis]ARM74895.1 hypothetical protein B6F84_01875 [Acidianus manzaensis]
MRYTVEFSTSHEPEALNIILADATFVIPLIFQPIKNVKINNSSFEGCGKFLGFNFCLSGNVYKTTNTVKYVFVMNKGGSATLEFTLEKGKVNVVFDYNGWMERLSKIYIPRWFKSFKDNFEEKVRLKRIERKI